MYPTTSISELMQKYEVALSEYGAGSSTKLQHLQRTGGLQNFIRSAGFSS
jgi:hypothetical protein